jgi:formylmethanofuran dehydrogenase subunit D
MTNTKQHWTVHLEEDPDTGDLLLPFPPDMLEQLGWSEGDTLTWTVNPGGGIVLSKKAKDD